MLLLSYFTFLTLPVCMRCFLSFRTTGSHTTCYHFCLQYPCSLWQPLFSAAGTTLQGQGILLLQEQPGQRMPTVGSTSFRSDCYSPKRAASCRCLTVRGRVFGLRCWFYDMLWLLAPAGARPRTEMVRNFQDRQEMPGIYSSEEQRPDRICSRPGSDQKTMALLHMQGTFVSDSLEGKVMPSVIVIKIEENRSQSASVKRELIHPNVR